MSVELGLGLLSIGRTWGVKNLPPPNKEEAQSLIEEAFAHGIRFFDTAPAYALSESILSSALSGGFVDQSVVTIATKMGEHWNFDTGESWVSHSYDDFMRSLDRSINLLGRIDILQLHKADIRSIDSRDVGRALDRASFLGIRQFGASVSDMATAEVACASGRYNFLQFPYNKGNRKLEAIFELLSRAGMNAIVNRPFAMGQLAYGDGGCARLNDAFDFIMNQDFSGIILTGTSSKAHLRDNIRAFNSEKR